MRCLPSGFRVRDLFPVAFLLVLSACGGSSDDDDGRIREELRGNFIDSAVQGLGYTNPDNSLRGVTDTGGMFRYFAGDSVSFRLDCIPLGSAPGQSVITPRTLTGGRNNASTNIARLLLSLDADGINSNGIDLTHLECPQDDLGNVDFNADPFPQPGSALAQFIADNARANASANTQKGQLVGAGYANTHLDNSEADIAAGRQPDGIAGAGPAISIVSAVSDSEGNGPEPKIFAFRVSLSTANPFAQAITVDFATTADAGAAHPATAGVDYTATSGTLSFASGEQHQDISVSIVGDTAPEPDKTFRVVLSNPSANATLSAASSSLGTIVDDDRVNPADPGLSIADAAPVTEGDAGETTEAVFTVTLSNPPAAGNVTVQVVTAMDSGQGVNPATANDDYDPTPNPATLTLNAATPSATVRVTVKGDDLDEPNETFRVQLQNAAPANVVITRSTAIGTIVDDDEAPATPQLTMQNVTRAEGDLGATDFVFTARLTANDETVTVAFSTRDESASGGASCAEGADYQSVNGELVFTPSDVAQDKTITVPVCGDLLPEDDETFAVNLEVIEGDAEPDSLSAIGTILDDDEPSLPVCAVGQLCVGASKQIITPSQQHIAGVEEIRFGAAPRTQKFNLGGFGINPLQNFPNPFDQVGEQLTRPADAPVFTGSKDAEHTHVRAMTMQQHSGDVVVFLMLDAVGAGNVISKNLKSAVIAEAAALGVTIAPDNIVFGQTHTHAGADLQGLWGGVPQDWINNVLYRQSAQAVRQALLSARPAALSYRQGTNLDFNNYRRSRVDADADADGIITLLEARTTGASPQPIGSILQYSAHPTSVNENPRIPHADYIQGAMDWLESVQTGPGGVALYYNGPIAEASASGRRVEPAGEGARCTQNATGGYTGPDGKYGEVRCRGEGIAQAARAFQAQALQPTLTIAHRQATLPVTNPLFVAAGGLGAFNRYYDFTPQPAQAIPVVGDTVLATLTREVGQLTPTAETAVTRITLGGVEDGLEVVTIPGEATNTFGQYIRGLKPGKPMMLLGLTQNSFGYIIPEDEFSYVEPAAKCLEPSEDPFCNAGLLLPFTGYEEFVSLGPLTAPLLRLQAYNPLFGIAETDPRNLPPSLAACSDPTSNACLVARLAQRVDYVQRSYAELCRGIGGPGEFCALLDPETPLNQPCRDAGLPTDVCSVFGPTPGGGGEPGDNPLVGALRSIADGCREFGGPGELCDIFDGIADAIGGGTPGVPGAPGGADAALLPEAARALLQGCDILDPAHCLFPFPNDHFTVAAAPGSPQSTERGGTGKRVNFNVLAMPRNIAGKPIDPTEWNRNDGFSPGQMILTFVPDLATVKDADGNPTGPIVGAPPITDIGQSLDVENAAIVVLDENGEPHPVWAEIDLNAGFLLPADKLENPDPTKTKRAAVIIRPATNFKEGQRYVVVLKNLRRESNPQEIIPPGPAFAACLDEDFESSLPPVATRCAHIRDKVLGVIADSDIPEDDVIYLAWDFTVASTENNVGRLRHMRDDAFVHYLGQQEAPDGSILNLGRAPGFTVTQVINSASEREIRGSFTIPSYVLPVDPSPLEQERDIRQQLKQQFPQFAEALDAFNNVPRQATTISAPPNRLFYNPADGSPAPDPSNAQDPFNARYGNGLPDRTGEMTSTFTCRIPKAGLDNPGTARPILYGHGLLGGQEERGPDQEYNMMYCKADWFGFAFGDVPNVVTTLFDMSNFPVIPDGSQQGMLNFMFLARLMLHPQGFLSDEAFRVNGQPAYDNREVFYDGNSQGGILGGPVIALSKDITRGVLGVPGMNYSTLLRRSVDFDGPFEPGGLPPYALPLYLSYQDDLDRDMIFSLIQMLWDRSENNGYAHHITDNRALKGPDKQVLLQPAFGDYQVTHWSAQVMARTIGVEVADLYPRKFANGVDGACEDGVQFCYANGFGGKEAFFEQRDPDIADFWSLPLVGREADAEYDEPGCPLLGKCRTEKSGFIEFDQGRASVPPIGNVPPANEGVDPHGYPRGTIFGRCQKSHFLHTQGRLIDVRDAVNVTSAATCPALPPAVGDAPTVDGDAGVVRLCAPDAIPGIGGECITVSSIPLIGPVLATLLNGVDGVTETVAAGCRDMAGPLEPGCAITDGLAQLVQQGGADEEPPPGGVDTASCAGAGRNLTRGGHYQVTLPSESGETISFEVFEPKTPIQCANGVGVAGAHPLILEGHGFGGSRRTGDNDFLNYRNAGYTVISIDQRGFGRSTGTVRTMDPDFEGQDLVQILDWAEANLDYLAYRDEDGDEFVERPDEGESDPDGANLLVGAIGGSYGGGFQFLLHNVDEKNRLDALAPDITWHDLRYSLNPGDTLKSAFGLLLSVGGTQGSYSPALQNQEPPVSRGLDPYIVETLARAVATGEFPRESLEWFRYHSPTYWCGLRNEPVRPYDFAEWTPADPNTMLATLAGDVPGSNEYDGQPGVDILISQGFRDNLFNFNEAWWNYQCARVRDAGADVRLITHQHGHILNLGGLTGQPIPPGTPLDVQTPSPLDTRNNCGNGASDMAINRDDATLAWFEEKLRGVEKDVLNSTENRTLCLSLADDDAIAISETNLLAPRAVRFKQEIGVDEDDEPAYYQIGGVGAASVPQGLLALTLHNAGQLSPSVVPLLSVGDPNGLIVAGIPLADVMLRTPAGVQDEACAAGANLPSLRTGCDAIVYVGLGVKRVGTDVWVLIDDQITPVRGLGAHSLEMVGVGERLAQGDELALLVYGYHPQYLASYSRDPSIPVVNVEADLKLPLYGVANAPGGAPAVGAPVAPAVNGIATGTGCTDPSNTGVNPECIATGSGANVVRQLCDYQFLPGVCEQFPHEDPGYNPDAATGQGFAAAVAGYDDSAAKGLLSLRVGAVHEHSGYSDGDPTAIPRDYFRAGRTGVNANGRGVKIDFMFSSEHSDNEKVPVTTSAACIPFSQNFIENPNEVLESDPATLTNLLTCNHADKSHHHFKWLATLQQAMAETERDDDGNYTGFTGIRGFEWTNDYYNHLNVYFSTNVVNVKVDGSYTSMEFFWNWLRRPVNEGGGADALVTFNHPGGDPALTPFDGGQPHNELLAQSKGGSNWNDLEYIPDVDRNVVGIEVNGGDDIEWYVKALTRGWHLGPVSNEDEHGRNWSSNDQGKTLILTRGRSPQDYYYAFQQRRTVALIARNPNDTPDLIGGVQGGKVSVPEILFWAGDDSIENGRPLGSIVREPGEHQLNVAIANAMPGVSVAWISNTGNGQQSPEHLGYVNANGSFQAARSILSPQAGEDWYFVVLCPAASGVNCGKDRNQLAVTAPIWFGPGNNRARADVCVGEMCLSQVPVIGPYLLTALQELDKGFNQLASACASNLGDTPLGALCPVTDTLASAIIDDGARGDQPGTLDQSLLLAAADAQARGCDLLDPAHCLYPFPSDHFTVEDLDTPQHRTGRRVNFNALAMPRNTLGKPIDPTEWNRNDGFSPGQLIVTLVPGLSLEQTYGLPASQVGIVNPALSLAEDAPIQVLDAETGEPQLVWAEMDVNAAKIEPGVEAPEGVRKVSLLIRAAKNFEPGRRYLVVLRNLKNDAGQPIPAGPAFQVCRDRLDSALPPVQARCAALEQRVFAALDPGLRDESLYLAWDFTVASTENITGRLVHMRDDAFATLGQNAGADCSKHVEPAVLPDTAAELDCRAPAFSIDRVAEAGETGVPQGIGRVVEGTLTVPSYLVPADASPQDSAELRGLLLRAAEFVPQLATAINTSAGVTALPYRLNYLPQAETLSRYGDELPDRLPVQGEVTVPFICQLPAQALDGSAPPARASLLGHGLLGQRTIVTSEGNGSPDMSREHNIMLCAVDWFGFSTGDLPNVASTLLDLSNFPVIPDASQQGMLNWMFLARAMQHPAGFSAQPAFQRSVNDTPVPVYDRAEIFYDGNSQGGILPGPVLAVSKDVNRGVFGVPGMNYSLLLRRSVDFDVFSIPLYVAYTDELDRNLAFSLIQMLWDRSENNGFAAYLTENDKAVDGTQTTLDGEDNQVLLHPAYGDHQVTMWSADVLARTLGASVDCQRLRSNAQLPPDGCRDADQDGFVDVGGAPRHPDVQPYFAIPLTRYVNRRAQGSAMVVWDLRAGEVPVPPITETPLSEGPDPHSSIRNNVSGRCQKAQFLRADGGFVADSFGIDSVDACKAEFGEPVTLARDFIGASNAAPPVAQDYGTGLIGAIAQYLARLHPVIVALVSGGDVARAGELLVAAVTEFIDNVSGLPDEVDPARPGTTLVGLNGEPAEVLAQTGAAAREVEPVVLTGDRLGAWSVAAAQGAPYPYPSGAVTTGAALDPIHANDPSGLAPPGQVRDAHNGVILYPPADGVAPTGVPVDQIAAFRWDAAAEDFVEIPVQVDEKFPYFLANANSDFSVYSGTDEELTYAWDTENWDPLDSPDGCNAVFPDGRPDPVAGLDHDDELVFMASDAGAMAPAGVLPAGDAVQMVRLADALDPAAERVVYLVQKNGGSSFGDAGYVRLKRNQNADQWTDRGFYEGNGPEADIYRRNAIGTSNTGYGPNLSGPVCPDGTGDSRRNSNDRFPRDGTVVSTDTYRWETTGRWMIRDIRIAPAGGGAYDWSDPQNVAARPDIIDRWKGRAFQQSPDSNISVVGFEDEQVNWEANAGLLGERCGPVRCIREIWGADSGTNVTKTETFYRDAVTYRYRVRVHPIPPDGLYTSWDYNRGAMLPTADEAAAGMLPGRYYTALRPQGVPIDGINDDIGQADGILPVNGQCATLDGPRPPASNGLCPAFFDAADPTFNLPLAFNNWEQVSGKGDLGSLVYIFENKGPTSYGNPLVVPYYRDDACLDDGTGDDPVARPFPGESYDWNGGLVRNAYDTLAGRPLDYSGSNFADCIQRQGAHAQHGVHYFVTHDTDNAFVMGKPLTEIDGQQWQFMVPTSQPTNVGDRYANVVRVPLQPVVVPLSAPSGGGFDPMQAIGDLVAAVMGLFTGDADEAPDLLAMVRSVLPEPVKAVIRSICDPTGFAPFGCGAPFLIPASDEIDQASAGGQTYYVYLPTGDEFDNEVIAFSVYEPRSFANGPHPLVLNGHGFGSTRTRYPAGFYPSCIGGQCGDDFGLGSGAGGLGGDMSAYSREGFWVIAMDQTGTGESEGNVRFMDPDYEIRKLEIILDWAEENLKLLAYRDSDGLDCSPATAVERQVSQVDGCNLLVGTTGPSYGGGYQYMLAAYDRKQRIDAIVPQITWHDLSYSLFPNDVIKSSYALGLLAASNPSTQGRIDPFIRDEVIATAQAGRPTEKLKKYFRYHSLAYACGDYGDFSQDDTEGVTYKGVPYQAPPVGVDGNGDRTRLLRSKVDALIWHGQHDAIFAFNEDFDNYACLRRHEDADVRLYSYQAGHVFPAGSGAATSTAFSFGGGFPTCSGPDCFGLITGELGEFTGDPQGYFGGYAGDYNAYAGATSANALTGCGPHGVAEMEMTFLKAKLQKDADAIAALDTKPGICLALDSSGDAVTLDHISQGQPNINQRTQDPALDTPMTEVDFSAPVVLNTAQAVPVPLNLITLDANTVLAGIPEISINIGSPTMGPAETLAATGSMVGVDDPIVFLALARSRGNAGYYFQPYYQPYCGFPGAAPFCGLGDTLGAAASAPPHLEVIDDQITPVRGFGEHSFDLNGIAERLAAGEQIHLLIYGYHPQYSLSASRNPVGLALQISGSVKLPLLGNLDRLTAANPGGGGGEGMFCDPSGQAPEGFRCASDIPVLGPVIGNEPPSGVPGGGLGGNPPDEGEAGDAYNVPHAPTPDPDPFYAPASVVGKSPGDILKSRPRQLTPSGVPLPHQTWQLQYVTTDVNDQLITAVATVIKPQVAAQGGPKLVSYQFAYDSLGAQCTPSRTLTGDMSNYNNQAEALAYLPPLLSQNWTLVIPDYEGPYHAYGAGKLSGQATLDGIRAALQFAPLELNASTPVGMWGYSGGALATSWAATLQPSYAPDLGDNLVGAYSGGTPADVFGVVRAAENSPFFGLIFSAIVGTNRAYPQLLAGVLNAAGVAAVNSVKDSCVGSGGPSGNLAQYTTAADPYSTPGALAVRPQVTLPQPGKTPAINMYLFHEQLDELIPIAGTDALVDSWCTSGVPLAYFRSASGEHIAGAASGAPSGMAYLTSRFAGETVVPPGSRICNQTTTVPPGEGGGEPPPPPPGGGYIGDPELLGVNPDTQCGSAFGNEGCLSDIPFP